MFNEEELVNIIDNLDIDINVFNEIRKRKHITESNPTTKDLFVKIHKTPVLYKSICKKVLGMELQSMELNGEMCYFADANIRSYAENKRTRVAIYFFAAVSRAFNAENMSTERDLWEGVMSGEEKLSENWLNGLVDNEMVKSSLEKLNITRQDIKESIRVLCNKGFLLKHDKNGRVDYSFLAPMRRIEEWNMIYQTNKSEATKRLEEISKGLV